MTTASTDEIDAAWGNGTYSRFARHYLPMAARLVEGTAVDGDDTVLDIACGTGNVAITAARRGAAVRGLDLTPAMLGQARDNAKVAGVAEIEWRQGDAASLPYDADSFDVTLSSLGHIYAEPPAVAGRELTRVTRPGGRIGFTAWTPSSLFPMLADTLVSHLDPADHPEFSEPPFLWGDSNTVEQRLTGTVEGFSFETKTLSYPALSPAHFWQELSTHSGLFVTFLEAIEDRAELRADAIERIESFFDESENVVELAYLETTATVS